MRAMLLIVVVFPLPLLGNSVPQGSSMSGDNVITGTSDVYVPGDQVIQRLEKTPGLKEKAAASATIFQRMRKKAISEVQDPIVAPEVDGQTTATQIHADPISVPVHRVPKKPRYRRLVRDIPKRSDGVRIFTRGLQRKNKGRDYYSLPSTSFALATLLHGIEGTNEQDDVVAELDYAWLGPNGAIVEMTGCRLWLDVRANYSTSRLNGNSRSMTCRAPNGDTFEIPIIAKIVDGGSEYAGAEGELVPHGKAMASALLFLQNGMQAWGEATAQAQTTNSVTGGGDSAPVKSSNVTGNQFKYIAGKSLSASSAEFLDWWINFYKGLTPTIAVGPGKKIYLVVKSTVKVPRIFFRNRIDLAKVKGVVGAATKRATNTGAVMLKKVLKKTGGSNHVE